MKADADSSVNTQEINLSCQILLSIISPTNAHINFPFMDEVDPDKFKLPNYRNYFEVEEKFYDNEYTGIKEFVCDFRLMLLNCYRYNGINSKLGKLAERLELLFEQKLMLLPSDIRNKTSLLSAIGSQTAEDDLLDTGSTRRRNVSRLFVGNDHRQVTPMRALMEECEQVRVGGITSSLLANEGEDVNGDGHSVESRVNSIANRLASWERKRYDEKLIAGWPDFWEKHGPQKWAIMKKCSEFLDIYQLLWLSDRYLCISECLTAVEAQRDHVINLGNCFRAFTLREFEFAFAMDVRWSNVVAACFNCLLVTQKERQEMTTASDALRQSIEEKATVDSLTSKRGNRDKDILAILTPPPYDIWETKLKSKIETWYCVATRNIKDYAYYVSRRLGVPMQFFEVFGCNVNPLEHKRFHNLSFFEQIVMLRALIEHTCKVNEKMRSFMDKNSYWEDSKPVILGHTTTNSIPSKLQHSYIHFPAMIGGDAVTSVRIYKCTYLDPALSVEETFAPEEFIEKYFPQAPTLEDLKKTFKENKETYDIVSSRGMPVPGPLYNLPRWVPNNIAMYTQNRLRVILMDQQTRLNKHSISVAPETKNKHGNKKPKIPAYIYEPYKLLPFASMEDLYMAEGKSKGGEYYGKNTKTKFVKAVDQATSSYEKICSSELCMKQSDYFKIKASKSGPYPPDFLDDLTCVVRKAIRASKGLGDAMGDESDDDSESNEGSIEKDSHFGEDAESNNPSDLPEVDTVSNATNPTSSDQLNEASEASNSDSMKQKDGIKDKNPQIEQIKQDESASVTGSSTPKTEPQLEATTDETLIDSQHIHASNGIENEDVKSSNDDELLQSHGSDAEFELVAYDMPSLEFLIDEIKERIEKFEDTTKVSKVEEPPIQIEEKEPESDTEMMINGSRKRLMRRCKAPSNKRAKTEEAKESAEINSNDNSIDGIVYLKELQSALISFQMNVKPMESSILDMEKLTRLRYRKDHEKLFKQLRKFTPVKKTESEAEENNSLSLSIERMERNERRAQLKISEPTVPEAVEKRKGKLPIAPYRSPLAVKLNSPTNSGLMPIMPRPFSSTQNASVTPAKNTLSTRIKLNIEPKSIAPRPVSTAANPPPRRIYRIQDTLFTEDCKPVRIIDGSLQFIDVSTLKPEHLQLARQRISGFKSGNLAPIVSPNKVAAPNPTANNVTTSEESKVEN